MPRIFLLDRLTHHGYNLTSCFWHILFRIYVCSRPRHDARIGFLLIAQHNWVELSAVDYSLPTKPILQWCSLVPSRHGVQGIMFPVFSPSRWSAILRKWNPSLPRFSLRPCSDRHCKGGLMDREPTDWACEPRAPAVVVASSVSGPVIPCQSSVVFGTSTQVIF